jgi:8-oxo-dGTP pyrophosphatase MutT (NUDIX family)
VTRDRREDVRDIVLPGRVVSREVQFTGRVWTVRTDTVELDHGETVVRDLIEHPGAVGIVALDERDRVLLVRQYRHPVGSFLWEAPAGLLDVEHEQPLAAAQRELFEEGHLRAHRWNVLVDFYNSPGASSEAFRCYLARDLEHVEEDERHVGHGEEHDMATAWVDLDDALGLVQAGRLHNPTTVSGVLAAWTARQRCWSGLRPADAPWPERFPES